MERDHLYEIMLECAEDGVVELPPWEDLEEECGITKASLQRRIRNYLDREWIVPFGDEKDSYVMILDEVPLLKTGRPKITKSRAKINYEALDILREMADVNGVVSKVDIEIEEIAARLGGVSHDCARGYFRRLVDEGIIGENEGCYFVRDSE